MKKFLQILLFVFILQIQICQANEQTGLLIIAPAEFKTQDFFNIAKQEFGENYIISKNTQDAWAEFCWNNDIIDSDPQITKQVLHDFTVSTDFEKIVFLIFKELW